MKSTIKLAVLTGLLLVGLPAASASAWTYGLTGSGKCQPDGSFKVTWKVDNSTEPQALNITNSSNVAVVPVGTLVAAKKIGEFTQNADGTKPGTFSLTLKGNWQGDQTKRERTATVKLDKACTQPTPPEGGRGGETPAPAPTPAPAVQSAQVVAPVGAVNAGNGSVAYSLGAIAVLIGSIVALSLGALKLRKNQ